MTHLDAAPLSHADIPELDTDREVRALRALLTFARQTALDIGSSEGADAIQLASDALQREFASEGEYKPQ